MEAAQEDDTRRRRLGLLGVFLISLLGAVVALGNVPADPTVYTTGDGLDFATLFGPNVNHRRFHDLFRMRQGTFVELVDMLRPWMTQNARDERNTSFEERIASVLYYFAHPLSQTGLQSVFSRAGSTLSENIHEVVQAIINSLSLATPSPPSSTEGHTSFHHFRGVIGAMDGTHIPVMRPAGGEAGFRNRKGWLSQNVLVAINFDLQATFVLAGSEGQQFVIPLLAFMFSKGLFCRMC
jgi:hypothetical protein